MILGQFPLFTEGGSANAKTAMDQHDRWSALTPLLDRISHRITSRLIALQLTYLCKFVN
jgi:hypothetical protein